MLFRSVHIHSHPAVRSNGSDISPEDKNYVKQWFNRKKPSASPFTAGQSASPVRKDIEHSIEHGEQIISRNRQLIIDDMNSNHDLGIRDDGFILALPWLVGFPSVR